MNQNLRLLLIGLPFFTLGIGALTGIMVDDKTTDGEVEFFPKWLFILAVIFVICGIIGGLVVFAALLAGFADGVSN